MRKHSSGHKAKHPRAGKHHGGSDGAVKTTMEAPMGRHMKRGRRHGGGRSR